MTMAPRIFHDGLDDSVIYLTIPPDRKSILYSQNERAGSDLMLVEHFQ